MIITNSWRLRPAIMQFPTMCCRDKPSNCPTGLPLCDWSKLRASVLRRGTGFIFVGTIRRVAGLPEVKSIHDLFDASFGLSHIRLYFIECFHSNSTSWKGTCACARTTEIKSRVGRVPRVPKKTKNLSSRKGGVLRPKKRYTDNLLINVVSSKIQKLTLQTSSN